LQQKPATSKPANKQPPQPNQACHTATLPVRITVSLKPSQMTEAVYASGYVMRCTDAYVLPEIRLPIALKLDCPARVSLPL